MDLEFLNKKFLKWKHISTNNANRLKKKHFNRITLLEYVNNFLYWFSFGMPKFVPFKKPLWKFKKEKKTSYLLFQVNFMPEIPSNYQKWLLEFEKLFYKILICRRILNHNLCIVFNSREYSQSIDTRIFLIRIFSAELLEIDNFF